MKKKKKRDQLPIFVRFVPTNIGEQLSFQGQGPYEVVQLLTEAEVAAIEPTFVNTVKNSAPRGAMLYWVECKEAEGYAGSPAEPRTPVGTVHDIPLYAMVWSFKGRGQAAAFEKKIVAPESPLAEALRAGCFYFLYGNMDSCWAGIFLSCADVSEETRKRIAGMASESRIMQIMPPPDELVAKALHNFEKFQRTAGQHVVVSRDLSS